MTVLNHKELTGAAYIAGRSARQKGENIESCPYAAGSATYTAWENGWYEKDADISEGKAVPVPVAPRKLSPSTRTSAGLRDAIFDELDALRAGTTDAKRASAVAKMASSIIETVRLELDVAKWSGQKSVESGKDVALKAISFKEKE